MTQITFDPAPKKIRRRQNKTKGLFPTPTEDGTGKNAWVFIHFRCIVVKSVLWCLIQWCGRGLKNSVWLILIKIFLETLQLKILKFPMM